MGYFSAAYFSGVIVLPQAYDMRRGRDGKGRLLYLGLGDKWIGRWVVGEWLLSMSIWLHRLVTIQSPIAKWFSGGHRCMLGHWSVGYWSLSLQSLFASGQLRLQNGNIAIDHWLVKNTRSGKTCKVANALNVVNLSLLHSCHSMCPPSGSMFKKWQKHLKNNIDQPFSCLTEIMCSVWICKNV